MIIIKRNNMGRGVLLWLRCANSDYYSACLILALSANWRGNECTLLSIGGYLPTHDPIQVPLRASGVKYFDRATRWYARQKAVTDDGHRNRRPWPKRL